MGMFEPLKNTPPPPANAPGEHAVFQLYDL